MTSKQSGFTGVLIARNWFCLDVYELVCTRPQGFAYIPGQHCCIAYGGEKREYTILPGENYQEIRFLIKKMPTGMFSNQLSELPLGTELLFDAAKGYLTDRESSREKVFIGTGTGIAPFVAMIKSGIGAKYLIHGAPSIKKLYYETFLENQVDNYIRCLSQNYPASSYKEYYFSGYVSDYVENNLRDGLFEFYLCGSWDMIRDVTHVIDSRFPGTNIYSEGFY